MVAPLSIGRSAFGPKRFDQRSLARVLPPGGLTYVQGCSAHSQLLADAAVHAGPALGAMRFTGIFVPGLNRSDWLVNPSCTVETFFMTPELRRAGSAVTLLPFCYADVRAYLRRAQIDAALFMVAPPDRHGICSFGPVADFLAELWPDIPTRIAHINPRLPQTHGTAGIPFAEITAFVEQDEDLAGSPVSGSDPVSDAIGLHVAGLVGDGATVQTGLGKIPDAILRSLTGHRNLHIHSGLVGEGVLDLIRSGALAEGAAIVAGVAIGSPALYAAISSERFDFRPVSYTHAENVLSSIDNLVTINSAFEVDLFGQSYAEMGPDGLTSGPGGASDFARGARSANGLRIVALTSGAASGKISRIVAPDAARGPVSLGRMETDVVVTEHGIADLRGLDHHARARALIGIAAPGHRDGLAEAWRLTATRF